MKKKVVSLPPSTGTRNNCCWEWKKKSFLWDVGAVEPLCYQMPCHSTWPPSTTSASTTLRLSAVLIVWPLPGRASHRSDPDPGGPKENRGRMWHCSSRMKVESINHFLKDPFKGSYKDPLRISLRNSLRISYIQDILKDILKHFLKDSLYTGYS